VGLIVFSDVPTSVLLLTITSRWFIARIGIAHMVPPGGACGSLLAAIDPPLDVGGQQVSPAALPCA
jgi:hypothetical protein